MINSSKKELEEYLSGKKTRNIPFDQSVIQEFDKKIKDLEETYKQFNDELQNDAEEW